MDTQAYISSGVIESYAMGLATQEEAQILQCIQKHNLEVKQAVAGAQNTIENLATSFAVAPPAHLKSSIWEAIQKEQAETSDTNKNAENDEPVVLQTLKANQFEIRYRFKSFAIAASIAVVVGAGFLVYLFQERGNLQNQIVSLQQKSQENILSYTQLLEKWNFTANPKIKTVVLAGVANHPETKAVVYIDKSTKQTYLSVENLPVPPKDHAYQLWAIVDGKPVDAGMCELAKDNVQKMFVIDNAQAFAITLEKTGGSKVPTMEQMFVIGEI